MIVPRKRTTRNQRDDRHEDEHGLLDQRARERIEAGRCGVDVVAHAADQLAALLLVVEGQRLLEQVLQEPDPERDEDPDDEERPQVELQEVRHRGGEGHREVEDEDRHQGAEPRLGLRGAAVPEEVDPVPVHPVEDGVDPREGRVLVVGLRHGPHERELGRHPLRQLARRHLLPDQADDRVEEAHPRRHRPGVDPARDQGGDEEGAVGEEAKEQPTQRLAVADG